MKQGAVFRGQPLLALVILLCAWIGLRAAWWLEPSASSASVAPIVAVDARSTGTRSPFAPIIADAFRLPLRPAQAARVADRADRSEPKSLGLGPIRPAEAFILAQDLTGPPQPLNPTRAAIGHSLLLAAGLSGLDLPPELAAYLGRPTVPPPGLPAAVPALALLQAPPTGASRLSSDAWLMIRGDSTTAVSGRPSYGRSQAGAVVRYRLAPSSALGPQAYLRANSALAGPLERDLAVGVSSRLVKRIPIRVAAEGRLSRTVAGTQLRPAVFAVTELSPVELPEAMRAEAYLQGGYVGGHHATAFVDGQARVDRAIMRLGEAELRAGAGAWGGAQKGAARLDVGPTAAIAFRLGEARGRVAADYRLRVAGDAQPRNGLALTVSAGF